VPYVLVYLATRFVERILEFVKDWYGGSLRVISREAVLFLEHLDRIFALQVNLRYIFHPLYQDRSIIGYILGFVFRSLRIMVAFVIYVVVVIFFVALYLAWFAIPLYVIYQIIIAYTGTINLNLIW